jgi:hypothetical protein
MLTRMSLICCELQYSVSFVPTPLLQTLDNGTLGLSRLLVHLDYGVFSVQGLNLVLDTENGFCGLYRGCDSSETPVVWGVEDVEGIF